MISIVSIRHGSQNTTLHVHMLWTTCLYEILPFPVLSTVGYHTLAFTSSHVSPARKTTWYMRAHLTSQLQAQLTHAVEAIRVTVSVPAEERLWDLNVDHKKQQNRFHPTFLTLQSDRGLNGITGCGCFWEFFLSFFDFLKLILLLIGLGFFIKSKEERMAWSNTSFRFFWVSAEHST